MTVERRPYYVTKRLRVRDLKEGDVAWFEDEGGWVPVLGTIDAALFQVAYHSPMGGGTLTAAFPSDLTLVDVQVRESPSTCLACGHSADRHTGHVGRRTDVCMDPNGACPCKGLVSDET